MKLEGARSSGVSAQKGKDDKWYPKVLGKVIDSLVDLQSELEPSLLRSPEAIPHDAIISM